MNRHEQKYKVAWGSMVQQTGAAAWGSMVQQTYEVPAVCCSSCNRLQVIQLLLQQSAGNPTPPATDCRTDCSLLHCWRLSPTDIWSTIEALSCRQFPTQNQKKISKDTHKVVWGLIFFDFFLGHFSSNISRLVVALGTFVRAGSWLNVYGSMRSYIGYMCPHTTKYVSSCCYSCTFLRASCYMCPHTAIHVSSYCCICVLILLYMFPPPAVYVCPHTAIYVSSYCCTCFLLLLCMLRSTHYVYVLILCMCPHTAIYVSSYYYICVLILLYCVLILCMCPHTAVCVCRRFDAVYFAGHSLVLGGG
jgi:hypothetical protein